MLKQKGYIYLLVFFLCVTFSSKAQVLFNMSNYRNLIYTSGGFNGDYANATFGIARRDFVRIFNKELIGVLDVSLPFSDTYFTKHSIRKGIQFDLWNSKNFRIPFMFASSTIIRSNIYLRIHDITTEFSLAPGIYKEKFTLALDCRYEVIVFRQDRYTQLYLTTRDSHARTHWEEPIYSIAKIGLFAALNLKRFVFYLKAGYEQNSHLNVTGVKYTPLYGVCGFGFKCGTRPMKEPRQKKVKS